ncbi:hypothetical protein DSM112329_03587 [Paraconexibacter sp. AEG42_29]|uniref:HD domain-containing protein n=1 Tax=Paraconexibacter sp. AEG42_29 TaxID=2997339 RepID=A0AAU7AYL9_9ACTN
MDTLPPVSPGVVSPLYRTLVDSLELGVVVVDGAGTLLSANPSAERLLGFDAGRVCGTGAVTWSFVDTEHRPVALADLPCQRSLATGSPQLDVTLGAQRADGSLVWLEFSARPTAHEGTPVTVLSFTDITARRHALALALEKGPGAGHPPDAVDRGAGTAALVERVFEAVGRESGSLGMQRICEFAQELLGVDIAYATEHDATHQHFRALVGDGPSFGVDAATSLPLEQTYCAAILAGRLPALMTDLTEHAEAMALPVTAAARVGSYVSVPIVDATGTARGTLCGASHGARPDLGDRDVAFLRVLAAVLAHHLEADDATDRRATAASARALAAAVEIRDRYTADHSAEVVELARRVAAEMGVTPAEAREAQQVALLHDLGKLGIADAILQKPGPLTDAEWRVMRTHPDLGAAIVAIVPELAHLADAIRAEHERWDGAGYPRGLTGEEIPLASRITFVCDAFHAMTSDRPYRAALGAAEALEEIAAQRGRQFCPRSVDGLLAVVGTAVPARPVQRS